MAIRTRPVYSVTLGIFDDYDKLPTVVFGNIYPYPGAEIGTVKFNELLLELANELLKAARKEYGSRIHRHAAFWAGATHMEEYEDVEVSASEASVGFQVQDQTAEVPERDGDRDQEPEAGDVVPG